MSKKFIEAGFPAPNQYDDWRSWAAAFLGALDGLSGEDITNLPLYVRKEGETREGLPVGAEGDLIRVRDEDGKNRLYVYEDTEGWKSTQETIEVDLSGKADIDLGNTTDNIDYVVESKESTVEDPSWWRIYKSGWIEQGDFAKIGSWGTSTVSLLKPMADTEYTTMIQSEGGSWDYGSIINSRTTTSFSCGNRQTQYYHWMVCGQGAQL